MIRVIVVVGFVSLLIMIASVTAFPARRMLMDVSVFKTIG